VSEAKSSNIDKKIKIRLSGVEKKKKKKIRQQANKSSRGFIPRAKRTSYSSISKQEVGGEKRKAKKMLIAVGVEKLIDARGRR